MRRGGTLSMKLRVRAPFARTFRQRPRFGSSAESENASRTYTRRVSSKRPDKTAPTVFVSYTHADHTHPLLTQLLDDLQFNLSVNLWLDKQTLEPGAPILSLIRDAITRSDYFIYVVSPSTTISNWTNSELHLAYAAQLRKQDVKIIPARIADVPLPPMIADIESLDLFASYDEALNQLARIIYPSITRRIARFDIDRLNRSGAIIDVTSAIDRKLVQHFADHPAELKTVDRRRFEELVAELFAGFGYAVELTARTRDGGRDVIAVGGSEVTAKYLIECKRPDPGHKLGIRSVRELFGVKEDERATKAILATTAYFSRDALLFFERHRWELEARDFDGLMDWIKRYLQLKPRAG